MIGPPDLYAIDLAQVQWRKSSYTAGGSACVEIAPIPGLPATAIRDSKNTHIPALRVSDTAWNTFVHAVTDNTLTPTDS